jgi:predicted DNA-binding transcriptional regulator AlpA
MKSVKCVSPEFVCKRLRISLPQLWDAINRGRMPAPFALGRGRQYRFLLSEIVAFLYGDTHRRRVTPMYPNGRGRPQPLPVEATPVEATPVVDVEATPVETVAAKKPTKRRAKKAA